MSPSKHEQSYSDHSDSDVESTYSSDSSVLDETLVEGKGKSQASPHFHQK
ncbi:hypothetical protein RSAG8_00978, partial [Rhizoctonia solani AG-8 WAC10335]